MAYLASMSTLAPLGSRPSMVQAAMLQRAQQQQPAAPFFVGPGGVPMTASQLKANRAVEAALTSRMSTPRNVGEGLSALGNAFAYRAMLDRDNAAEQAGVDAYAKKFDALGENPTREQLMAAAPNGFETPGQQAIWQAEMRNALKGPDYRTIESNGDVYRYDANDPNSKPAIFFDGPTQDYRPLTDPANRAKYGISPDDTGLYEVGPNNQLSSVATKTAPGAEDDTVDMIVQGIVNGNQPPDLKGLYGKSAAVRAGLEKQGYDFTKANQDWTATQKLLSTMNGPGQTRLRQAVNQVSDSLPLIEGLAKQWKGSSFPVLNKANLALAKNGAYGPDAQSLATQMDAEIADVAAELATVYRGGNTATDRALEQAEKQFSADWSESTLLNAIALAKTNVAYRRNSLNLNTAGIADSQYNPMKEGAADQPIVGSAGVTAAPGESDYPDGTVIEDGSGNRMVMRNGQWEPAK